MTEERLPLAELLAKADDGDFLRSVAEAVVQLLMEADAEGIIGAGRHERSGERTTYRVNAGAKMHRRAAALRLRPPLAPELLAASTVLPGGRTSCLVGGLTGQVPTH